MYQDLLHFIGDLEWQILSSPFLDLLDAFTGLLPSEIVPFKQQVELLLIEVWVCRWGYLLLLEVVVELLQLLLLFLVVLDLTVVVEPDSLLVLDVLGWVRVGVRLGKNL